MAAFNDNMSKIAEDTKALQNVHRSTKVQLKKVTQDIEQLQASVTDAKAVQEVLLMSHEHIAAA